MMIRKAVCKLMFNKLKMLPIKIIKKKLTLLMKMLKLKKYPNK